MRTQCLDREDPEAAQPNDLAQAFAISFAMWLAASAVCLGAGNVVFPVAGSAASYVVVLGVGGIGAATLAWTLAHIHQRRVGYSSGIRSRFAMAMVGLGLGLDAILMTTTGLRYPLLDADRQRTIVMFMIVAYSMYALAPTLAWRRRPRLPPQ